MIEALRLEASHALRDRGDGFLRCQLGSMHVRLLGGSADAAVTVASGRSGGSWRTVGVKRRDIAGSLDGVWGACGHQRRATSPGASEKTSEIYAPNSASTAYWSASKIQTSTICPPEIR